MGPQVSPGVRANNYYDNFRSYSRQNRLSGSGPLAAPANLRQEEGQANNLPLASGRPRRKYKINREQNRDAGQGGRRREEQAEPEPDLVLAANTYSSPTGGQEHGGSVESLTKNIYSQVGSLISSQARTPSSLARLLHSLTLLGLREEGGARKEETSSFTSEDTETRGPRSRRHHQQQQQQLPLAFPPVPNSAFDLSSSEQLAEPRLYPGELEEVE